MGTDYEQALLSIFGEDKKKFYGIKETEYGLVCDVIENNHITDRKAFKAVNQEINLAIVNDGIEKAGIAGDENYSLAAFELKGEVFDAPIVIDNFQKLQNKREMQDIVESLSRYQMAQDRKARRERNQRVQRKKQEEKKMKWIIGFTVTALIAGVLAGAIHTAKKNNPNYNPLDELKSSFQGNYWGNPEDEIVKRDLEEINAAKAHEEVHQWLEDHPEAATDVESDGQARH